MSSKAIVVGKKDVSPEASSHVKGVHEGNDPKASAQRDQLGPRRSTGIAPELHGPIDPRMPTKITPA